MSMGVEINKIEEEDVEKAYQFCLSIFDELVWGKRFAYGLENLKEFFSGEREVFFVAKLKDKIVGCGGIKELSKNEALMKRFYIAKEFRGRGLAQKMLEKIKQFAKKQNYKRIVLDVDNDNFRAIRFYQKQGFKIFNPEPNKKWKESQHPEIFEYRKLDL